MRILLASLFAANLLWSNPPANEQRYQHQHDPAAKVGRVNFRTSCSAKAQSQFNVAVAWLHSFEYQEAEKAFTEVATIDPSCGMAYWGLAMSSYHQLWAPPTPDELSRGVDNVSKAKNVSAKTQRERDYIAAIDVFYKDADTLDHRTRTFAYHEAMKRLYQQYPEDREAGVFYALTLISTGTMSGDKTYRREKEAAQILNRVLEVEPQHPGVSHYLIHSYDYPALAQLALSAARSYAKIAPDSSHAQHMPSHIFTRLGLWQESIQSNLDARASAKAFAVRNHLNGAWDEQLHAMDYLVYAYLQGAQDRKAWGVLEELNSIKQVDPPNFKVAYAFAAIPARYALERRHWSDAAKLSLEPGSVTNIPWDQFTWAAAHIHFAKAVGAARSGDIALARQETEQLGAIKQALGDVKEGYDWAKQVEIKYLIASAWLAFLENNSAEALHLMRAGADLDDATEKHPVTPGSVMPGREQLGELLIELKKPTDALVAFETSLKSAPNRFIGLYGAAGAAKMAGDNVKARIYYSKLVELSRFADSPRPEIDEAKTFLKTQSAHSK